MANANEYKLKYSASDLNARLEKVAEIDPLKELVGTTSVSEQIASAADQIMITVGSQQIPLSTVLGTYSLKINYNTLLAFDTTEIIVGNNQGGGDEEPGGNQGGTTPDLPEDPGTTAVLGVAVLGQMVLG